MYIFIYRLKSENFEHDHYMEAGGNVFWESLAYFYQTVKDEDKVLSSPLFLNAIRSVGSPKEMLEFFTSVTLGNVKIVDVFSNCNRIDIGQELSPA